MNTSEPSDSRPTVSEYIERNPLGAIVQAVAIGLVIGLIIRWLEGSRKKERVSDIDIHHKPDLEEAKYHLGSLLLPFLWPAWQKTREKYGHSAESIQEAVAKLKKSDLAKIGGKKAKLAAAWADREAAFLAKAGSKTRKQVLEWLEQEAAELAKAGRKAAEQAGEWVGDQVAPAAECGWKKLKKMIG